MTPIQANRNHAVELSTVGLVNSELRRKVGTTDYTETELNTGWSNELYV